jgi:hypothetical protein
VRSTRRRTCESSPTRSSTSLGHFYAQVKSPDEPLAGCNRPPGPRSPPSGSHITNSPRRRGRAAPLVPQHPAGASVRTQTKPPAPRAANLSRVRATSASVSGCERLEPDSTATARDDEPQHATGRALVARRHERPNVGVAVAAMRGVSPDQAQRSEVAGRANRQHRRQASRASATRAWIGRNRRARLSMSRARSTPDAHIKPEAPWPHRPPPASHSKRPSRQRHDHRCPLDKPHPISAFPRR